MQLSHTPGKGGAGEREKIFLKVPVIDISLTCVYKALDRTGHMTNWTALEAGKYRDAHGFRVSTNCLCHGDFT